MLIHATMLVELDEQDMQEFEQSRWPYDDHYKNRPYFEGREAGPFLIDLERVSYETREWLEKYNGGWEGFVVSSLTRGEHEQMRRLATLNKDIVITLYPERALLYMKQSFLEWIIREMARTSQSLTQLTKLATEATERRES